MERAFYILPIVAAGSVLAGPLPEPPGYLDSHAIIITCPSANHAKIDRIHVWVSNDGGGTWEAAAATRTGPHTVCLEVNNDGKYGLYIALENQAGSSAAPPDNGSTPHLNLIVDTAPPTLQIHAAGQSTAPDGSTRIDLSVSLIDEHLGEAGVRVFYRDNADVDWHDGGAVVPAAGVINWRPPAELPEKIDIRVAATDLAGNRGVDEIRDIPVERVAAPAEQHVEAPPQPEPELESLDVPPVEPVTVAPLPLVTLADEPSPPAAASATTAPSPSQVKQSELLRERGTRFLAEGRFALAGARFHDALELTPESADLESDLGSVLFHTGQYDQAASHFQRALDISSDHLGAIEGLALVAVGQKRYPEARSHLEHLLRLRPAEAEHWLHFGDVQHMLGNVVDARSAWNKVLKLESADEEIRGDAQERLRLFGQGQPAAK